MRTHLAILAACFALGCSPNPTELLVVVESDLAVPAQLDEIVVVITHPDGVQTRESMAALGPAEPGLPRTLAMVHEGGPLGPYRVVVQGRLGGVTQVERAGELTFVAGEIRIWRVVLAGVCRGVACPDATCDGGACRAVAVGEAELEGYDPDVPRDGGFDAAAPMDAGVDASPEVDAGGDAGNVCPVDCVTGDCLCAGGCTCSMTCPSTGCAATCRGAGTSCRVDTSMGLGTTATCEGGASCTVDASGSSGFDMGCSGAGTRCDVDCSMSTGCTVRCGMGALCILNCASATGCEIRPCSGGVTTCPDGVEVCGSGCP